MVGILEHGVVLGPGDGDRGLRGGDVRDVEVGEVGNDEGLGPAVPGPRHLDVVQEGGGATSASGAPVCAGRLTRHGETGNGRADRKKHAHRNEGGHVGILEASGGPHHGDRVGPATALDGFPPVRALSIPTESPSRRSCPRMAVRGSTKNPGACEPRDDDLPGQAAARLDHLGAAREWQAHGRHRRPGPCGEAHTGNRQPEGTEDISLTWCGPSSTGSTRGARR